VSDLGRGLFSFEFPAQIETSASREIFALRAVKITIYEPKVVIFTARDTNIYKICELHRAIFSPFYNI
jgi:hypothetical protein